MKTTLNYLAKGSLVAVLASVAACGAEAEGPTELALDVEQEPVINGTVRTTNRNVVALYTRPTESYTCGPVKAGDNPLEQGDQALGFTKGYTLQANTWWPRPCSGVLIKKDGDDNYILTARHCITQQGAITGTVIPGNTNIRTISTLNPGVLKTSEQDGSMSVSSSPPAAALNTSVVYQNSNAWGDLAILYAKGNLGPVEPALRVGISGFSSTETTAMNELTMAITGYGRNQPGNCYGHKDSGAGVLRYGSPFDVSATSDKSFTHASTTATDQEVTHGDSGGPAYRAQDGSMVVYGANSTSTKVAGGQNLVDFVQGYFGHVYLTKVTELNGSTVVRASSLADGAYIYSDGVNDGDTRWMTVNRATGKLLLGIYCLNDEKATGGQNTVRLRACTAAGTAWDITPTGWIKNRNTGRCMTDYGGTVITEVCTTSSQRWVFTADQQFD